MKKISKIPIYKQEADAVGGIDVRYVSLKDADGKDHMEHHMDDHYIFILHIKGTALFHCDMENLYIEGTGIAMIKPYQVHGPSEMSPDIEGYFMSLESFLIPNHCRDIFESLTALGQHIKLPEETLAPLRQVIDLMLVTINGSSAFKTHILHGLMASFINQAAELYSNSMPANKIPNNQSAIIALRFKELLEQYSFLYLPSFYAKKLNITTAHLNHCLKATTGLSVTHWLQDAMANEAKRQLYYTDNDSKEIAYALGYEDHTYFSRLFKKVTGESPVAFRKKFRE